MENCYQQNFICKKISSETLTFYWEICAVRETFRDKNSFEETLTKLDSNSDQKNKKVSRPGSPGIPPGFS